MSRRPEDTGEKDQGVSDVKDMKDKQNWREECRAKWHRTEYFLNQTHSVEDQINMYVKH